MHEDSESLNLTCPLRIEVNFNFCLSKSNLIFLSVTECRSSEIDTHAFHRFFWHPRNYKFRQKKLYTNWNHPDHFITSYAAEMPVRRNFFWTIVINTYELSTKSEPDTMYHITSIQSWTNGNHSMDVKKLKQTDLK